jgi:hypothetical protein
MTSNYCSLVTDKQDQNKYYNIWIASKSKGESFTGRSLLADISTAYSDGYEVYARFGDMTISGPSKTRHLGYYFSRVAAERSAERIRRVKIKTGFTLSIESDGQTMDLSEENSNNSDRIKITSTQNNQQIRYGYRKPEALKLKNIRSKLFEEIPLSKTKMTNPQKDRFLDILE